jgi:hypothetical protein
MRNLSKAKWRGQNGKFTKCKNCGKGFTVKDYNKHKLNCGVNLTSSTGSIDLEKAFKKTTKKKAQFKGSIKQMPDSMGRKRSEVIAEIKRSKLNGPYTIEDERELNRIVGSKNAGFVKK